VIPTEAAGLQPGTVVVLNGASSSGKTSILRQLQELFVEPFLDAGIDRFIWMLPRRYLDRPLWDDVLGLATTAGPTGHRLFSAMHHAIAALSAAGSHVLADHVLVEPAWVAECAALFAPLPAYLVAVHCPLVILEERERSRRDRTLGQAAAQFELVHAHAHYDFEVDTPLAGPAECARAIHDFVVAAHPPTAFRRLRATASLTSR
jgi:chloramphenicol 3-O phosphotransferase